MIFYFILENPISDKCSKLVKQQELIRKFDLGI